MAADFAVAVTGQGLDDEVTRILASHGPALRVTVTDRGGTHVIVTLVAGIECQSDSGGTVDIVRDVVHAHRDPDLRPSVLV